MDAVALLETVEVETGPQPGWTVVLLHGLGDSGAGWAPVVPDLVGPDWPAVRFVFPHAPVRPVTVNGGMPMRAWYDIVGLEDLEDRADEAGLLASVAAVEALLAREAQRGVPASRVVLAGFSQGGAVALALALLAQQPPAALVALSTYLPAADRLARDAPPGRSLPPVFMAHGRHDQVVPYRAGAAAADRLRAWGFDVDWRSYPIGHEACFEEFADLTGWLSRRFAAGG